MAPLILQLSVLALAGMSLALPQGAPDSKPSSLEARQSCGITSTDNFLLGFNGCTQAAEACHYCCPTWSSEGPNCHDDADPHPGGLCPGDRVVHCAPH
ncbi:hypothetical protein V8F20_005976 [Naviculisporaceae sp. PSN 640]